MNKNISVWRGPESPPTNYHVWIKDDNSINVYDKTEWKVTSYPELKDDLKLYILEQIKTLKDGADYDIQAKELTKVTYAELKQLRDNGELVEGHLYRITDYEFTTVQRFTKSAGHVFDIIVLATSTNELSHIARAIAHEGDTYFDGNDLGAWELLYDLDNDTTKYEWADAENGKGVIYRMIDEKHNDCPYDFKNALFYNEKLTTNTTPDKYYYTFSYVVSGKLYDGTVEKQVTGCYGNSMGVYIKSKKKSLNRNVWRNTSFGDDCYNTLGDNCFNNTFGYDCYNNTFGYYCYNNFFGNTCHSITFENTCSDNTFGDRCSGDTFRDNCSSNTFGNSCNYNTFGHSCGRNTFGNSCFNNTFGNNCKSNIFGYSCCDNSFGNFCDNNLFGIGCNYNTFGNYCGGNIFKDGVTLRKIDYNKTPITLNDEYYDDGSGQLVPVKHPDLSTQPSILPYKFMGNYVYEQLIPVKLGDRIVNCDFEVEYPMILSAGVFGFNSFKNVDIIATKSDALLLNTESELDGYINVKYTDGSQLLFSNGYGYGYENNNTESSSDLIDFGLSPDGTIYVYDPNTEVLSLYKSGEITQDSIPQNLLKKNIILGEGVTSIGNYAFSNCGKLTSINIPNSVTSIGNSAFNLCDSLTAITIPDSVTSIGNNAFFGCSSLTSINIPNSVTSIRSKTFYNCTSLSSINIPESVTSIGNDAFYDCISLTSITIPNSVTTIGIGVFEGCRSLTSINIPNSVTSIGNSAFYNCTSLTSITVDEGNSVYDSRNKCNAIIETSSNSLIQGCVSTVIPNSVTSIGKNAFYGCSSLTSINIPESVTSIEDDAFSYCSSLTSITCNAVTPPTISSYTFYKVDKSIPVYVPTESVDTYKVATYWKDFTNIQAI